MTPVSVCGHSGARVPSPGVIYQVSEEFQPPQWVRAAPPAPSSPGASRGVIPGSAAPCPGLLRDPELSRVLNPLHLSSTKNGAKSQLCARSSRDFNVSFCMDTRTRVGLNTFLCMDTAFGLGDLPPWINADTRTTNWERSLGSFQQQNHTETV